MSKTPPDQEFWNIADAFIERANEYSRTAGVAKVSAALLYAASRFNAFVAAAATDDESTFRQESEKALEYFSAQYKKMLRENLDDWADNYKNTSRSKRRHRGLSARVGQGPSGPVSAWMCPWR